jgi:hypothetical protein
LLAKQESARVETGPNRPSEGISYVDLARVYKRQESDNSGRLQAIFRAACGKAGIQGKSFHCFRVALCTALANSDTNTFLVCAISWHSDPKTFMHYVRTDKDALRSALRRARLGDVIDQRGRA